MRKLYEENNAIISDMSRWSIFRCAEKINVKDHSTTSHIPLKQKH